MKKIITIFTIGITFLLSSCGINTSMISNLNQNNTTVQLSSNNFKVVDKVFGSAEVRYVFLLGSMKKRQLYENAYSAMITKANLLNSSKAIINIVTEEQFSGLFPIYYKRTITVSANVIEFTK